MRSKPDIPAKARVEDGLMNGFVALRLSPAGAYATGYDKGKSDAVKQQYWLAK
ncbi:MAG: hypothetical protein IH623_17385 [Verrucomicrobia bacterium]|nr:hypothetical protein [Verrucomicrobiota bacterium]